MDGFVELSFDFVKILQFFEEIKSNQIGIKCGFRDGPRITFEAVVDAMFA